MRFSCLRSYVEIDLSIEQEWIRCGWLRSGKRLTISFFWSKILFKIKRVLLTVELNKKLFICSSPNSYSTVLTSRKDIVGIDINGCDWSSMSICNFPNLLIICWIETANKSISPACHNSIIIKSYAATWSTVQFTSISSKKRLILGKIPNFYTSIFINANELIWPFWTEMNIIDRSSMSISVYEIWKIICQDSIEFTSNSSHK